MNSNSQVYLGLKNAIVLCVDNQDNLNIAGRIYHLYSDNPISIYGYNDFFLKADMLFNDLGTPALGQSEKNFDNQILQTIPKKEMKQMVSDNQILNEHGEQGTFIVRVQHRQHSSWQGRVTWVDENKTVYFRSELELMKLIDGALNEQDFEETVTM